MYRQPGQHNVNGYDLYSFGPDGQEGGADDIDNWSQR
jgi:general secretion pathway protein G